MEQIKKNKNSFVNDCVTTCLVIDKAVFIFYNPLIDIRGMHMKNKYLTERERYKLEILLEEKKAIKEIALILNKSKSTIYREIHLGTVELIDTNLKPYKKYCADRGQSIQDERSHNKGRELKIGSDLKFVKFIEHMVLDEKYSPVAILSHIRKHNLSFDTDVCYKTIYNYISNGVFLNLTRKSLPMPRKKIEKQDSEKRIARNHIDHTSIEERPKEIRDRLVYGHWELDTVESGKGDKTCLFVFTERMTREELIFKADSKSENCLIKILNRLERNLSAPVFRETFKTITCDNGCEFLNQDAIEKSIYNKIMKRTKVYYCHPYNANERGSNENANKLIRRWIPKGCHISEFTDKYIKDVEEWVNNYPRKLFNYLSCNEYKQLIQCIS